MSEGIECPACAGKYHRTIRTEKLRRRIRRRRECRHCGRRFSTYEVLPVELPAPKEGKDA